MKRQTRIPAPKPANAGHVARIRPGADPSRPESLPDSSPSRYIARISRKTGKEIAGPINPDELLVHAWRDKHPREAASIDAGAFRERLAREIDVAAFRAR